MAEKPERRTGGDVPPTMIMSAYREMDADDKNKMERIGYALTTGSASVVLVGGLFYDLAVLYFAFAGIVFTAGVCFIFPAMGVWLFDVVIKALEKIIPAIATKTRVDRRADR